MPRLVVSTFLALIIFAGHSMTSYADQNIVRMDLLKTLRKNNEGSTRSLEWAIAHHLIFERLYITDEVKGDWFGFSSAINNDGITIISAPWNDEKGGNAGAAHVYKENLAGSGSWGQVRKIYSLDTNQSFEYFGNSVDISGDTAVVGQYRDAENDKASGSVYLYYRHKDGANRWGLVKKLIPSDNSRGDAFGSSVSIDGDTLVVGASHVNLAGKTYSGVTYIFQRNQNGIDNWGEVRKITAPDSKKNLYFGGSVSISGDIVAVGAKGDTTFDGAAYIFYRNQGGANNWGFVKKVKGFDITPAFRFGHAVSIDGGSLIVGAFGDPYLGCATGSAYIFLQNRDGPNQWGQAKKLTASDADAVDAFGESVSISGDTAVVGAYNGSDNGVFAGSAYIFSRHHGGLNNWGQVRELNPPNGADGDLFGGSVAVKGNTVLVGAQGNDSGGIDNGSAYIFSRNQGGQNNWGFLQKIMPFIFMPKPQITPAQP